MSPVFGHGALRLYLLHLLDEEPRHGYEIIRALEDRFLGMYTPSAGTIYPRLTALTEDGLVEHEMVGGKKVYRLTDAGRRELQTRRDEVDAVVAEAAQSARALAREIRDEVRAGVRDLRRELKEAVRDVRREERRSQRESQRKHGNDRRGRSVAPATPSMIELVEIDSGGHNGDPADLREVFRSLRTDLESFVSDVVAAARRHRLDAERVRLVREALLDAREAVIEALDGRPPSSDDPATGQQR